jgi:hypothetical protein
MSTANNNNGYNNKRSASDGDADGGESKESFVDKMKRIIINFGHNTKLCCFKVSKQTEISVSDFKVAQIKKKFGIDYLTLIENDAPVTELKSCLKTALKDIAVFQDKIDDHLDQIDGKEQAINSEKIVAPPTRTKSVTKKMEKKEGDNNNNEIQVQLPTATIDEIHDHDSKNGSNTPVDQQQRKNKKKKKKSTQQNSIEQ